MKKTGIALALVLCLLFCFAGCGKKKGDYDRAQELLAASSFAQAEELYASLGDYADAADKLRECKYLLAQDCAQAQPPDVLQAVRLFAELGGYRDAAQKKAALQEEYFFAQYAYRIPAPNCIMTGADRTEDDGTDANGAYHRHIYAWEISGFSDTRALSDRFVQWIAYLDDADGVTTQPYQNGTYFLCLDDAPIGMISSQKDDNAVRVTVVLYDEPME